jgi:hypothetical protein
MSATTSAHAGPFSGNVPTTPQVPSASAAISADAVTEGARETRTGGGQRMRRWNRNFAGGAFSLSAEPATSACYRGQRF